MTPPSLSRDAAPAKPEHASSFLNETRNQREDAAMTRTDDAGRLEKAPAYHQAGHAVMASILGVPALGLTLCPEDGDPGYALPNKAPGLPVRDWLLITLAGHQAEIAWLGTAYQASMYETAARLAFDMLDILRTFERRGMKSAGVSEHLRGQLGRMLAALFADEAVWAAVAATAEALDREKKLDQEALCRLIPGDLSALTERCPGLSCDL